MGDDAAGSCALDGFFAGVHTHGMWLRPRAWVGFVVVAGTLFACEPAAMPSVPGAVDSGGDALACEEPAAVSFAFALAPVPEDSFFDLQCTQTEVRAIADELTIGLRCEEAGGPVTRTLSLRATPPPPRAGLASGGAVRLRGLWSEQDGATARFVRLETGKGALLVAAARGAALAPADGTDLWLPFSLAQGAGSCMSEETACGEALREAVELRRSGGAPRLVFDGNWAAVGDREEAQVWVAAAQSGDAACVGAGGSWFEVGLMAAR